jgi:hypothetical protein
MTKKQQEQKDLQEWEDLKKNPVNNFACQTCDAGKTVYDEKQFKEHLKTVHGITEGMAGKKSMVLHMDFERSFSSQYHWKVDMPNGTFIEFDQFIHLARKQPML